MATRLLENTPLLDTLEKRGISVAVLTLVFLIILPLLAASLTFLVPPIPENSPHSSLFSTAAIAAIFFVIEFIIGLLVVTLVVEARLGERDLIKLAHVDPEALGIVFSPSTKMMLVTATLFLGFGQLIMLSVDLWVLGIDLTELMSRRSQAGIGLTIIYYVVVPLSNLIAGLLISFVFSYGIKLCQIAKIIKISLHMDTSYSVIANPITRLLVVFLIGVSLLPLFSYLVDQRLFTDFLILSFALFIFIAIPLFILFCIPIVTLARRIRAIKDSELSIIREELMHIEAGIRSESNQVDSLMVRQMFIESRKEWPIGPQLQRVFFFGLLPPLTWTLAATIENILY